MSVALHHGDCRTVIPTFGCQVDAIVTDPPYGLEFMGQEWDNLDRGLPQENVWKGRRGKGGSSIKDDDRTPGSRHGVNYGAKRQGFKRCTECGKRAFSGSPCCCAEPQWTIEYSEGPPSSAVRMQRWHEEWARAAREVLKPGGYLLAFGGTRTHHRMACAIEDAGFVIQDCLMWLYGTGFPKRRDVLKPAYEPIIMAYKPGGARTLQVDECRVGDSEQGYRPIAYQKGREGEPSADRRYTENGSSNFAAKPGPRGGSPAGRWPANLCHDGSDEVLALFPDNRPGCKSPSSVACESIYRPRQGKYNKQGPIYPDTGSAARFFFSAKAGAQDRWGSKHPTVKPVELMKWLVALVTPPQGLVLDPFAGSGTTGVAALAVGRNAILIERDDQYAADIRERLAFYEGGGGHSMQAINRNRTVDHGPLFDGGDTRCPP